MYEYKRREQSNEPATNTGEKYRTDGVPDYIGLPEKAESEDNRSPGKKERDLVLTEKEEPSSRGFIKEIRPEVAEPT